jgi:hypothetical protein
VPDGARHGPAGDQVSVPFTARDREREAHAGCATGEQPVREPEVAVGLRQHERNAKGKRSQPGWSGHVPSGAERRIGASPPNRTARAGGRAHGQNARPQGLQRRAAIDAPRPQVVDLVSGGGDQARLGPPAGAEE